MPLSFTEVVNAVVREAQLREEAEAKAEAAHKVIAQQQAEMSRLKAQIVELEHKRDEPAAAPPPPAVGGPHVPAKVLDGGTFGEARKARRRARAA